MKRVLIAAVLAMFFASPSLAEKLTLTVSGTLSSGDDNSGVFGANTDLTGESVSVQFFIDTSLGTRTETGNTLQYIGGYFYPTGTPVTSGAITVGGVTHIVGFPIFGELYEALGSATTTDDIEAQVSQLSENQIGPVLHFDNISILSESLSNGQVTPNGFDMPFSYSPSAADPGTGTFTVFARNVDTDAIIEDAEGTFKPSLVTLSITGAAAPEPSTWAMMLAGFAGLGFMG
jgi:opacity protein-like surface antigen